MLQYNGKLLSEGANEQMDGILTMLSSDKVINKQLQSVDIEFGPIYDSVSIIDNRISSKSRQRFEVTIKMTMETRE